MEHKISHEDMLDRLQRLAKEYGVRNVRVQDWREPLGMVQGAPPASASLSSKAPGALSFARMDMGW